VKFVTECIKKHYEVFKGMGGKSVVRFFKKTEGAISIFLCIVLLIMIAIPAILVEGTS